MKLSVVFLSKVSDESSCLLLKQAIESVVLSTEGFDFEIIIVESGDIEWAQRIVKDQGVIIPYVFKEFNFHKALNLGLAKALGAYICFSNNDVIFYQDWYKNIHEVMHKNNFGAASPVDPQEDKLWMVDKKERSFVEGYEIQKHFKGWCFVVDRRVFKVIKQFDERFDFYFADNDFITQIEFAGFKHASVLNSKVHHLAKSNESIVDKDIYSLLIQQNYTVQAIPNYIIKENRWWMLQNKGMIVGLLNYHQKWGAYKIIKFKKILSSQLHRFHLSYLARFLFLKQ